MSAFETFVTTELPKRPALLTDVSTGYDGDPNSLSAPSALNICPRGTLYLRSTNVLYQKGAASSGNWVRIGSSLLSTTEAMTLYVSTTGSDSADGLTVGTPLATITAALNKVPFLVKGGHPALINVAAGTYVESVVCPSFVLNDNVTVQGAAMVATAPGAGAASGTFDASFAGQAFTQRAVLTGAGWAAGGLTGGFFVELLDGPNVGLQFPVVNNAAGTLDVPFPCNGTGPYDLRGRQFRLVKASTIIAPASGFEAVLAVNPITGSVRSAASSSGIVYVSFAGIELRRNTAGSASLVRMSNSCVRFSACAMLDVAAGSGSLISVNVRATLRMDYSLTYKAALASNTNLCSVSNSSYFIGNGYGSYGGNFALSLSYSSADVTYGFFYGHDVSVAVGNVSRCSCVFTGIDGSRGGASVADGSTLAFSLCAIKNCTVLGVMAGMSGFASSYAAASVSSANLTISSTPIDNCVIGVMLGASVVVSVIGTSAITNCTSAGVNMAPTLRSGHNTVSIATTVTMSGNTIDFSINGSASLTVAALRALTPKLLTDSTYFNRLMEV